MPRRKYSRLVLTSLVVVAVAAGLALAFWPKPVMVDMAQAGRDRLIVTIDEEGRTRVAEAFVVSTPVDGRLLRVEVEPGDPVEKRKTVVARMRPANPAALDARTREQALAAVEAAEATLNVAEANLSAAQADYDLAQSDLDRTRRLAQSGTASTAALDRAEGAARSAEARLNTARAAIAQRQAELQSSEAQLIGFDDRGLMEALDAQLGEEITIHAPAGGVILQVIHEDETTLPAGSPILVIGDIGKDLEVVVELISSDAVQVREGAPVVIENWGGDGTLEGVVTRVEPFAVTKVSALGVEEQRVTVVVRLAASGVALAGLGHGYSVEARIVVLERDDALVIPSSAVFRDTSGASVFVVEDGAAALRAVEIGADNGRGAEVLSGLDAGARVILYPSDQIADGTAVEQRVIE